MAEYPSIVLTNAGLDMIAESQAGQSLIFTKLKIGDGLLGEGESISLLTTLKSPKLDIPIQGFLNQGNGQVRLRYLVDNSGVPVNQGFFAREVGVYAKLGETGTEKLYAYTNGGNKVDWIPDKNTPMDAQIFDVFVLIGNASNVTVMINGSATYATVLDLSEHNDDENVHGKAFENHNADLTAHPSLLQSITSAVDKISKKGNGIGRNMIITGPKDSGGSPIALYSDLASGDIKLKAGTKLTFADGLDDNGTPIDIPVNVLADVTKTLSAADQYTIPLRYTPDLCTGGTAISGGDNASFPKANAYDNNADTYWGSSQSGSAVNNTSYIGYVLPTAKDIRKVKIVQASNDSQSITAAELQYSLDGSTNWAKLADVTLNKISVNGTNVTIVTLPHIANAKGVRVIARSATGGNFWCVYEMEAYEALQTHYLYADYLDGVISLVSSKNAPRRAVNITDDILYSDNLCVGGAIIKSGESAQNPATMAFDGDPITPWSSETGTAYSSRYIGYDFGVARSIKRVKITANGLTPASVKIQSSTDGNSWADRQTVNMLVGVNIIDIPTSDAARFWRMIGNSTSRIDGVTATSSAISVIDVTMHELSDDIYYYDPETGRARHYDGNTWQNVTRVYLGSANVDSAGKIVSVTCEPYNMARLMVRDAELPNEPVSLGQFKGLLETDGYIEIPNGSDYPLIIQWFTATLNYNQTSQTISYPYKFPLKALKVFPTVSTGAGAGATNGVISAYVEKEDKESCILQGDYSNSAYSYKVNVLAIGC